MLLLYLEFELGSGGSEGGGTSGITPYPYLLPGISYFIHVVIRSSSCNACRNSARAGYCLAQPVQYIVYAVEISSQYTGFPQDTVAAKPQPGGEEPSPPPAGWGGGGRRR